MSFGKLYGYGGNPRTKAVQIVAKLSNLDLEIVDTQPGQGVSSEYRAKYNKLGKIPTFESSDSQYILSECIAIAVYFASQNEKTTLLGKTKQDYASILRWMSFTNSDFLVNAAQWFRPLMGQSPYNKKNVEEAAKATDKVMTVFEDHLLINTYLVGERITLADIFAAALVGRAFELVFDAEWRKDFPNVTRWYQTIANQSAFKELAGEPKLVGEAIKYTPPKKDEKPKAAEAKKEAPKPKAAKPKEDDDEDDEPKEAPKPKHPIEALGKPTFALDDWKRKYKNEETREVALPWFWENMNFEEYSIWSVDYKYNDELTQTFMTSNLIGGFFARLEASRKYIMGCASVYGETNDSIVKGAFVIRGKDALQAFDVAPDWESYEFKQLDPKSTEHKEFVESMWAWDKPITVEGKEYKWADGKIFV